MDGSTYNDTINAPSIVILSHLPHPCYIKGAVVVVVVVVAVAVVAVVLLAMHE